MTLQTLAANAVLLLAASSSIVDSHSSLVAAQNDQRGMSSTLIDHSGSSYAICPEVQSLRCRNGSTCLPGASAIDERHSHLNLQTNEDGYYCDCLPGFIGHECQVEVDDCDPVTGYDPSGPEGALRSCYHGSKCRTSSSSSSSSSMQYYCDCESLNRNSASTAQKYAGIMCQHASTSMCAASLVVSSSSGGVSSSSTTSHSPNGQFCTNHGTCVRMVSGDELHPGCVCKDGWTGERCEQEKGTVHLTAQQAMEFAASKKSEAGVIAGNVLLGCYLVLIAALIVYLPVAFKRARGARDVPDAPPAGDSNFAPEKSSIATRGGVGVEALDADGSTTLGNFSIDDGDMESTLKEEVENGATALPGIV
ncbi:hypothetical protein ACHAXA_010661 [Cyclostephanos tholiformis]|uniref:EGF-like domain-containing protein n=1 Tax=Cyclostephanos tholiformis TaxID=382380 RepID=A0ABD3RU12_9STRA